MAGTIVANQINTDTGLFSTNNAYLGIAKAWVNWTNNGSGGITTNSSFNISSVTYNSTGLFTIALTTAFSDAYPVVVAQTTQQGTVTVLNANPTTSSAQICLYVSTTNALYNGAAGTQTHVAFFHA